MDISLSSRETTGGALMKQRSRQLAEPALHLLRGIAVAVSRLGRFKTDPLTGNGNPALLSRSAHMFITHLMNGAPTDWLIRHQEMAMGGYRRFCTRCGRELRQGGRFCTGCGHTSAEPAAPTMPAAAPVSTSLAETISRSRPEGRFADPYSDPEPVQSGPPARPDLAPRRSNPGLAEPRQRRARWPLVWCLVVLLAGGGAAAAVLVMHHRASSATDTHATSRHVSQHPAVSPSATAASAQPPEQQAADSLSALLGQSVADRSAIVSAVNDVNTCGPSLSQDVQTFQNAATSRQNLLAKLANVQDRAALPAPMLQALSSAWQASTQADQDFAQWAQDELSQGCVPNDHSDPNYQAASGPDSQATTAKEAFASRWDPIATQYGLPTYQWSEL